MFDPHGVIVACRRWCARRLAGDSSVERQVPPSRPMRPRAFHSRVRHPLVSPDGCTEYPVAASCAIRRKSQPDELCTNFGTAGRQWLEEQHFTYLAEGFQAAPG
jgi:hypothetical protein